MKRRSGEAQAALGRKAGPMRHRLAPRGGAKNDQADLLAEVCPDGCTHRDESDCLYPLPETAQEIADD